MWNTISGFCFVTFTQHIGGITGLEFSQNGQVIIAASLDGTVRAFDLNRSSILLRFIFPDISFLYSQSQCLVVVDKNDFVCNFVNR